MNLSELISLEKKAAPFYLPTTQDIGNAVSFSYALSEYLQDHKINALAVYCHRPSLLACALLACNRYNIEVYLLNNAEPGNVKEIESHVDCWLSEYSLVSDKPFIDYQALLNQHIDEAIDFKLHNQQNIYIQTSGSTGRSKLIHKTWGNLIAEAQMLAQFFKPQQFDNIWGSVSPQHMYGLSFRVMLPLVLNVPINDFTATYPEAVLKAARQYPNSLAILSPTILTAIFNGEINKEALIHIEITSAGAHLPSSTQEKIQTQLGKPICEIYGSSETGVIAYKKQHLWQFFPSVQYHDENDKVSLSSDWMNQVEILNDRLEIVEGGFKLLGRSDRIIKIADKRISLPKIEDIALLHPYISDIHCLTYGRQNRIMACIALNEQGITKFCEIGRKQLILELRAFFKLHLEPIAHPRYWRFKSQLPRDKQGKIKQSDLQKLTQRPKKIDWQPSHHADYQYEARVPLDLIYFSDHFSSFPLVPGVVEIQWVVDALIEHRIIQKSPVRMENIKFQQFMCPHQKIYLSYSINRNTHKISYKLSYGKTTFASGRAVFNEDDIL